MSATDFVGIVDDFYLVSGGARKEGVERNGFFNTKYDLYPFV